MPKYTVRNSHDGTDEALDPDGTNAKVNFNNSEGQPAKGRSSINRVVMIVLAVVCCVVVLLLCAWFIYSVFFNVSPEWQRDDFMIESIPGLRYNPLSPDTYEDASLITYEVNNSSSYKMWKFTMDDALKDYTDVHRNGAKNLADCDYDRPPKTGQVCVPDMKSLFPCVKENNFGYHKGTPCVFIRFNKIPNWTPQYYNSTSDLPKEMPERLRFRIAEFFGIYRSLMKTVWLSCDGVSPADKMNMGNIVYQPRPGFPGYYFPYNSTENYLSPLVAVYFEKPKSGTLIHVECRLWAPNIEYDREKGHGLVNFQLKIN